MSLANVQGKLSRAEMKNIMAGTVASEVEGDDGKCVEDGKDCPVFGKCCNECKATFKCGK
ncbi:hypothetical protein [Phnomibacter sp. MR]|uniref:hypothetical protein n=1 Tax=Phnomibacter sp. MR TaxID=3042318 RepID=UPI003A80AAA0